MTSKIHDKRTSNTTDEWLTPPELVHSLGKFDLDPCSPVDRPWDTADIHLDKEFNGLNCDWWAFGMYPHKPRVWMNPPYGRQTKHWLKKLAQHGNGIALVYARTEQVCFHDWVWPEAHAISFLKGRVKFIRYDGKPYDPKTDSSPAASVLIAYGENNVESLYGCSHKGKVVKLK